MADPTINSNVGINNFSGQKLMGISMRHNLYRLNEEANLMCIKTLKEKFGCSVGYSGHESGAYLICVAATLLGASSIERHITLARDMYGSDHSASLEPMGLVRMVRDVRDIETILGDGIKRVWDSEIPVKKKLRG